MPSTTHRHDANVPGYVISALNEAAERSSSPCIQLSAVLALDILKISIKSNKAVFCPLAQKVCALVYGIARTVSTEPGFNTPKEHVERLPKLWGFLSALKDYVEDEASRNRLVSLITHKPDREMIEAIQDRLGGFMWSFKLITDDNCHELATDWIALVTSEVRRRQSEYHTDSAAGHRSSDPARTTVSPETLSPDLSPPPPYSFPTSPIPSMNGSFSSVGGNSHTYTDSVLNYNSGNTTVYSAAGRRSSDQARTTVSPETLSPDLSPPPPHSFPTSPVPFMNGSFSLVRGNSNTYANSVVNHNSGNTTTTIVSDSCNDSSVRVQA
ncbi:hypothetical protein LshimejAT787_3400120 [Lyophyllum shimeji]|uniref:Uncharacterized protein n=1 Tax=Lyophyllum shimeji TaxID=47721 RepID=A0A9P3Q173_LYOSH|nr:hypothetical protein LshimejAT787_1005840 [Lyophyllum shimeji]GLB45755.1 hypothetical protein LshimejAT787_2700250 [Lyophyllum shimeji]GLB45872.1 hypothetical protein LshimejAT787_3400120 [Lyophyllum shimeji]